MIKLRIEGLPEEASVYIDDLRESGKYEVLDVSKPYQNRGNERVRIYVTIKSLVQIDDVLKDKEREQIREALSANRVDEAETLFKYSTLTLEEYEAIQTDILFEARENLQDWSSGEELARKAKEVLKIREEG